MGAIRADPSRIFIASIVFLVVAQLLHVGGIAISIDYYTHPNHYDLWSPLLISFGNINTGISFFLVNLGFGFLGAVVFVLVYTELGKALKGSPVEKGVSFGLLVFLVTNLPGSMSMFLLLNIPVEIVILWVLESFIIYLVGGAFVGYVLRQDKKSRAKAAPAGKGSEPSWMKKNPEVSKTQPAE